MTVNRRGGLMDRIANSIKNRLSLRPPQTESLQILSELSNQLNLQNNADLQQQLEIVKKTYPTCTDFERNFPSICFALANSPANANMHIS